MKQKLCKKCGSNDFYIKESIDGVGFVFYYEGESEPSADALHDGLSYKRHKKAYCVDCEACVGDAEDVLEKMGYGSYI